jgi:hypothetical protein
MLHSGDQIKEDEMGGTCNTHVSYEKCVQSFVGKLEGKRALGRPRCRWEDNIKMDLRETGWEVVESMHLIQGRD